jgi:enediyne biosynthesis thioesterase
MFLREHAPEVLAELSSGLVLATVRVSCEYYAELAAFDEVLIRMQLGEQTLNRITMVFEYWRAGAAGEERVARGEQTVACLRREGAQLVPCPVPPALLSALQPYRAPEKQRIGN